MKKDNTWNIRRLVDNSFVPLSKGPSVNWRISQLKDVLITYYDMR